MHAPVIAILFAAGAAAAAAQTPAPAPSPAAPQAQARPPAERTPTETYTYSPEGRRDPFLNLIGTGTETLASARKGEGPAGMTVAELSVTGILQSRGALVAMVQGPDKKTYIVHQGDKFADGTIRSVTAQGLVITQEVNDPLSLVKQREIRKLLRSLEDGKE